MDYLFREISYIWRRYPPYGGWLSLFLLAAALFTVVYSALEARWVPEGNVVVYTALVGFLLGTIMAHRKTPSWLAWSIIIAYTLLLSILFLSSLFPGNFLFTAETRSFTVMVQQNFALFGDRVLGWWLAVSRGGSSQETIVFSLGMGIAAGLLAAYATWSTYRQRTVLAGIAVMSLALALNGYFSGSGEQILILTLFLACAVLLVANLHFANQENRWNQEQVDYSGQIRLELLLTAGGVAFGLMMFSFILPTINVRAIADTFRRSESVTQAEQTLERVFAGVREPFIPADPSGPGGSGILPRAFLLGNAPELSETVVMTATVSPAVGLHWRAISYDVYTGRGWARSDERTETYPSGTMLPVPTFGKQITVTEQVNWVLDNRLSRYSIGEPIIFDLEVDAAWRGVDDLVRVNGVGTRYEVVSRYSPADASVLRQTSDANTPPEIIARYTSLPDNAPDRVVELAQEITAGRNNNYDQAIAIEQFLRQYTYDLDVSGPPIGQDPVDYFLFDLQRGYCDYYASAMVVMARAIGLPARLAIGYLAQPPDEQGVQTMYHINAHSWAEIYFPGMGWVEFEPTAAFPTNRELITQLGVETTIPPDMIPEAPPPIPEITPETASPLWAVLLIALLIGGFYLFTRWMGRTRPDEQTVWHAYAGLQKAARSLESIPQTTQTPTEFESVLLTRVDQLSKNSRPAEWLAETRPGIQTITQAYNIRQYSSQKEDSSQDRMVWQIWQKMRRTFWLTGWWVTLRRILNQPD